MNNRKIWLGMLVVLYIGPYVRAVRTRNVASQEDIEKIKYLLQANPEQLNSVDENGETLLYKATKNSSQRTVRFLLIKGADVNIKNSDGSTPLHVVTSAYIARELISRGANLDARDNEGKTPLHRKFMSHTKGDIQIIKELIKNGADVNAKDKDDVTPLHMATGSKDLAEKLVENGADVNAKDKNGATPLHMASRGSKDLAAKLIENGADVNAKDNNGRTPLHLASETYESPVRMLLFENGANVNAKDKEGTTPLHMAARWSKRSMGPVVELIENGAGVNAKDNNGQTPLHFAVKHRSIESAVKHLVDNGAEVNAKDKNGQTPLHLAAKHRSRETVMKHLVDNGAEVNVKDNDGMAPLHFAATISSMQEGVDYLAIDSRKKNINVSSELPSFYFIPKTSEEELYEAFDEEFLKVFAGKDLRKNKDLSSFFKSLKSYDGVNEKLYFIPNTSGLLQMPEMDRHGNLTRPKNFTKSKEIDIFLVPEKNYDNKKVKILLSNGAQVNTKDNFRRTPLHIASIRHDEEIVKTLIDNGADVNVKDNKGMTPLHWAAREGLSKIFCLFIHQEPIEEMISRNGEDRGFEILDEMSSRDDEVFRRGRIIEEGIIEGITGDAPYLIFAMSYDKATTILSDANWSQKKNESLIAYFVFVSGHEDVIRYLVSKRARINAIDNGGRSPLAIAEKSGHKQVVNLLSHLEKGTPASLIAGPKMKQSRILSKMMLKKIRSEDELTPNVQSDKTASVKSNKTASVKSNKTASRLPDNGKVIRYHSNRRAIAPFEIKTRSGSGHYFVKLVSMSTKKDVLKVFVHDGRSVEFKVPLGSYELKYAVGKTWYGPERLFGPDTKCSKADKILSFKKKGNQVLGHSVELYLQLDGNLQTEEIPRSEF